MILDHLPNALIVIDDQNGGHRKPSGVAAIWTPELPGPNRNSVNRVAAGSLRPIGSITFWCLHHAALTGPHVAGDPETATVG
jgi:hypothetical protein